MGNEYGQGAMAVLRSWEGNCRSDVASDLRNTLISIYEFNFLGKGDEHLAYTSVSSTAPLSLEQGYSYINSGDYSQD